MARRKHSDTLVLPEDWKPTVSKPRYQHRWADKPLPRHRALKETLPIPGDWNWETHSEYARKA